MNTLSSPTQSASPPVHPPASRVAPIPVLSARPVPTRKAGVGARFRGFAWKLGAVAVVLGVVGWAGNRWLVKDTVQSREITATVVRGSLPIIVTERGELESSKSVDVRCEVQARQGAIKVVKILAEGTRVKKDEEVVTLDTEELTRSYAEQEIGWKQAEGKAKAAKEDLEVQKNKAASEIAKAELTLILAKLERDKYIQGEYRVELDKRQGEIALARRELLEAQEKLEHYRKFVKKGFGTLEQLRYKEVDVLQKKFVLDSKEAELMVLEKFTRISKTTELTAKAEDADREVARTRGTSAAGIAKAQSDWEASEITTRLEKQALDRMKKQLDLCIIKAPQDGILVYSKERYWDASSRIQSGAMVHYQQGLFTLPDLSKMQVKVKIHESMIKKIAKGLKVEIKVESYANQLLHGTVEKMDTLADSRGYWDERGVKEYVTIVKVNDLPTGADLKPGMTAEVKILANELPDVLMVPVQAIAELEGQHYGYVVAAGGVERRAVKVGENNEKFVEVREGLEEGEQVALDARSRIAAEAKARESKPGEAKPTSPDANKALAAAPK